MDSDEYVDQVAFSIADQLNRSAVNKNLAKQVLNLAKSQPSVEKFVNACKIFGNFDDSFLHKVYSDSRSAEGSSVKTEEEPSGVLKGTDEVKGGLYVPKPNEHDQADRKTKSQNIGPRIKNEDEQLTDKSDDGRGISHKRASVKKEEEEDDETGPSLSLTARKRLEEIRQKRRVNNEPLKRPPSESPPSHARKRFHPRGRDGQFKKEESPERVPSYEQESLEALDRDWYNSEEFGHVAGDDMHNPFYDSSYIEPEAEKQIQDKFQKRVSLRAAERQRDSDIWEKKQMRTSGIIGQGTFDPDFEDDTEDRVHLFVHNLTPPFLDGKQIFTRQRDPVSAVRDPQSDLAIFARRGSALVKERRQQRERQKQSRAAVSLAGTTLGNVMGVQEQKEEEDDEDGNSKWTTKFSDNLNDEKNTGTSKFATEKSLREQRQFLPAFAVREELLNVIRDNQGKFDLYQNSPALGQATYSF
ncbi:hypothetical protein TRICI_005520 [Trichomonascus ciferrii]|uniref:Uncharacterized protein n=1 Tax=Trichomonascus ciferrii TaxID=44093 RepID=A0A642UU09_9ASCO|nr:hypothetical protein TRICI_005520 [Trichomonascus ciferrii]